MIRYFFLQLLQLHYEHSNTRNINQIPLGNILQSLDAQDCVNHILLISSITSTLIQTVLILEDYFYSTKNVPTVKWIYTN